MLRRKRSKPAFRYFFATDIHGSDRCFRKFLAAACSYKADALILGGDIAGKAIVPLVQDGDGRYRYEFQGVTGAAAGEELDAIVDRIRFNGLYPYRCSESDRLRLAEDDAYQESLFERLIVEQVRSWRALAAERLRAGVMCIITPGNDDPLEIDDVLEEPGRTVCPERKALEVGPMLLLSLGNTNRTPWNTDREFDEQVLAEQIDEMVAPVLGDKPLMFNFHCPPFDSGLDKVTKLDENLSPVVERGIPVEVPVGSTAVRAAIERYEPEVGLHGHIHESQGARRLGRTICINPGSDYGSGWLKGALVDVDEDGRYVSHLLTSG